MNVIDCKQRTSLRSLFLFAMQTCILKYSFFIDIVGIERGETTFMVNVLNCSLCKVRMEVIHECQKPIELPPISYSVTRTYHMTRLTNIVCRLVVEFEEK